MCLTDKQKVIIDQWLMPELSRQVFFSLTRLRLAGTCYGALFSKETTDKSDLSNQFWYSLELFLFHLGLVSRYLFPNASKSKKRYNRDQLIAAEMRARLGISEDSILSNRALRDSMEHYDERLEEWCNANPEGGVAFYSILTRSMFFDTDPKNIHWLFDSMDKTLHIRDDHINLVTMYSVLKDLLIKLERASPIYFPIPPEAFDDLLKT